MAIALEKFHGQQSLDGLKAAINALQLAYRQAGFGAVVVTLPEQTLADGTVKLQVTEGKLGQVQVTGAQQYSAANVRRSLPALQEKQTPNLITLDAQSLLANENPSKNIRLVFQPGLRVGEVDVVVSTTEQPVSQTTLSVDNTGRPASGTWRAGVSYMHANMADADQVLRLRLETSLSQPANNPVVSATYRIPLYGWGGALDLNLTHSQSNTRATSTAAGDLSYSGQGSSLGARYQWLLPQAGEAKQQLGVGLDMRHYRNTCQVGELGSAGCGTANNSVGVRPVMFSYQVQSAGKYSGNLTLSANLLAGGRNGDEASFEASRPGAKRRYTVLRGQWQSVHPTGDKHWLSLRASGQISPHALIAAEQFGVGGASTVRGYLDRELVGDQGLAASAEWSFNAATLLPTWADLPEGQTLFASVFADMGQTRNKLGTACMAGTTTCSLASAGLGLQWSRDKHWALKAELGRTLKAGATTASGKARLHVSYNLHF